MFSRETLDKCQYIVYNVSVEIEYFVAQLFVEVKSSQVIVLFYLSKRGDRVEYKNNVR